MHEGWVLRKGVELVKIENGGSSLTFRLCRILLKNTTKKVMIMSAISMASHHLKNVNSFHSNIPSTQLDQVTSMNTAPRRLCQSLALAMNVHGTL